MTFSTRVQRRWLAAMALACLGVAWVAAPAGVPLYDGVGFPDEPYRYVRPPAGYRATLPPTGAESPLSADHGVNSDELQAFSTEIGPQVTVYVYPGYLVGQASGPAATRSFDVRVTPQAPDGTTPVTGTVDGNVYRVEVTADPPGPVTVASNDPNRTAEIDLRATAATSDLVTVNYRARPEDAWQGLSTVQVGNDIYAATFAGLGDYVLTVDHTSGGAPNAADGSGGGSRSGSGGGSQRWAVTGLIVIIVLCAGAVVIVRLGRTQADR